MRRMLSLALVALTSCQALLVFTKEDVDLPVDGGQVEGGADVTARMLDGTSDVAADVPVGQLDVAPSETSVEAAPPDAGFCANSTYCERFENADQGGFDYEGDGGALVACGPGTCMAVAPGGSAAVDAPFTGTRIRWTMWMECSLAGNPSAYEYMAFLRFGAANVVFACRGSTIEGTVFNQAGGCGSSFGIGTSPANVSVDIDLGTAQASFLGGPTLDMLGTVSATSPARLTFGNTVAADYSGKFDDVWIGSY